MFVGELEFEDLPIKTGVGYLYFLTFVFVIVVVLMNLLNGLAVSDTGVCRAEAEIYTYKSQVELIAYTESVLLGDPFNFLANFPAWVWLRRLPSFRYVIQFTLVYILMKCLQSWYHFMVKNGYKSELVSKELNHFGVIADLFQQIGGHSSRFVLFCSF